MNEEYYKLDFGKYFKAIYRQKWVIILCLCASLTLALSMAGREAPLYQAGVSFWIRDTNTEQGKASKIMGLFLLGGVQSLVTDFDTQMAIMKSSFFLKDVVKKLGLPSKTDKLTRDSVNLVKNSIFINKAPKASIIEVKAVHPSPEMALKMANAILESYIEFNNKLFIEQEQIRLESMEAHARQIRETMGQTSDLITERIKGDMYLILMEKIAETRLNLSLGQSEQVKVLDKAEEATIVLSKRYLQICLAGIMGLFLGIVLAIAIDAFIKKKGV